MLHTQPKSTRAVHASSIAELPQLREAVAAECRRSGIGCFRMALRIVEQNRASQDAQERVLAMLIQAGAAALAESPLHSDSLEFNQSLGQTAGQAW